MYEPGCGGVQSRVNGGIEKAPSSTPLPNKMTPVIAPVLTEAVADKPRVVPSVNSAPSTGLIISTTGSNGETFDPAAATARNALRRPYPKEVSYPGEPRSSAVCFKTSTIWVFESKGLAEATNAATPAA